MRRRFSISWERSFGIFESGKESKAVLTRRVYTQIKRLLTLATDFGFDENLVAQLPGLFSDYE